MDNRAEFSRKILNVGGTYSDVNRLEEEGRKSAVEAFTEEWKAGEIDGVAPDDEAAFSEWCYQMGRNFVLDNLCEPDEEATGDYLYHLEHPENAEEQKKLNRWKHHIRNIQNAALAISQYWAIRESVNSENITDDMIADAFAVLNKLNRLCRAFGIDVREV